MRSSLLRRAEPSSDPELRETLEALKRALSFANADAQALTWDQAVDRMAAGGAAMNVMGDSGARLPSRPGWRRARTGPDLLGTDGVFVFTSDVFKPSPRRRGNPVEAAELLRTIGSSAGQVAFSLHKGSIPARVDARVLDLDPAAQAAARDFQAAHRVPHHH